MRAKVLRKTPYLVILEGLKGGKRCVTGVFTTSKMTESSNYCYIQVSDESFMFYYEDTFCMNFRLQHPGIKDLGYFDMWIINFLSLYIIY